MGVGPADRATDLDGVVALALAEQLVARRLAGLLSDRTLIGRQQRVGLPPPIGPVPEAVLPLRSGLLTRLVLRQVGEDPTQLAVQQLRREIRQLTITPARRLGRDQSHRILSEPALPEQPDAQRELIDPPSDLHDPPSPRR